MKERIQDKTDIMVLTLLLLPPLCIMAVDQKQEKCELHYIVFHKSEFEISLGQA